MVAGLTPAQVDTMSLWQFQAAIGGWMKANNPEAEDALSREDEEALGALIDAPMPWELN